MATGFAFDVTKPMKTGYLWKMGGVHKSFKQRFFVLYKGFLVYYEDNSKWKFDTTIGDTLGVSNKMHSDQRSMTV